MKKMMKAAVCGMALIASLGLGMIAEAGSIPTGKVPLHTYAVRKVTCYMSPGGAAKGWIDPGDYVIVNQIRSDGWAYGSYPVKNGRTSRWFKANDLVYDVGVLANTERYSPKNKTVIYKDANRNTGIGSVWNNEAITMISGYGKSIQIIYKINGGYKMGWIHSDNCLTYDQAFGRNVNPTPNPYIKPVVRTSPISNGWYKISTINVQNRVLDVAGQATNVGSNIQLWDFGNGSNQKFQVINQSNEYFLLKAGNCDLYLSAANSSGANGTNVQLASKNGSNAQLWRARSLGNGVYYLESKLRSNLCIDCSGAGSANGTNIQLWDYGNGANQKWKFESVSAPINGKISPSGFYYPLGKRTAFVDNTGEKQPHDFTIAAGTPVYALADGTIYCYQIIGKFFNKWTTVSYGNVIYWVSNDKKYGAKYAHLKGFKDFGLKYPAVQNKGSTYKVVSSRSNIYCGSKQVKAGDVIGYVGSVGNSTGPHLHFELIQNPNYSNGYMSGTRLNINSYFNQ